MTKYRICPYATDWWIVQRRVFGFFWVKTGGLPLDTEQDAEERITDMLLREEEMAANYSAARDRRKRYVPREFP